MITARPSRRSTTRSLRSVTRRLYLPPWRIDITERPAVRRPAPLAELARTVSRTIAAAGAPSPASLGLWLSDDPELGELNVAHMGASGPTDVLSFPLLPAEAFPGHVRSAGGVGRVPIATPFTLPPRIRLHLGDVFVSVERAIEQAEAGRGGWTGDVRWTAADELRLLVTHGALHLCGWDHADPVEEAAMRRLERELLGIAPA